MSDVVSMPPYKFRNNQLQFFGSSAVSNSWVVNCRSRNSPVDPSWPIQSSSFLARLRRFFGTTEIQQSDEGTSKNRGLRRAYSWCLERGRGYVESEGSDFGSNLRFLNIAARGLSNSIWVTKKSLSSWFFSRKTEGKPISHLNHLKHIVEEEWCSGEKLPDHFSRGDLKSLWIHQEPIVVNDDQTSPPRRRLRKSTETGSTPSAPSPSPVSGSASPMRRVRGKSTEKTVEQIYQKLEADVFEMLFFFKGFFCFFRSLQGGPLS